MPSVSIIIPCFGVEKYLDRCMETIVNQTLKDIEIILVDDVSPDRVPEMCDEWAKKDSRIKVVHKEKNEGLGFARNTGLEVATGEYVAFVDSDDFVDVKMYETLYNKALDNNSDVVLCNCVHYRDEEHKSVRYDVKAEQKFEGRVQVDEFLLDMVGPLPSYSHDVKYMMSVWHGIYKRSIFEDYNVRFESERVIVSEDMIFNLEYYSHVDFVTYLPNAFYYYCFNGASLSHTYSKEKYYRFIHFLSTVEARLKERFTRDVYKLHLQRLEFLYLRSILSQSMHNENFEMSVNDVLDDDFWSDMLSSYPYQKMDFKHVLFFFCLKNKLIGVLRFIM